MTTDTSPRSSTLSSKTLRYTAAQRRHESGAMRRDAKIQRRKEKQTGIQNLEASLSKADSCSPTLKGFQSYLEARFHVQKKLYKFYGHPTFRLYRWWTWKDRRKSEDRFVQRATDLFGANAVLAYGTWSSWNGMKGLPSSPLGSFKKRLAQKFTVVDVPEYNTSKTCSRCHGEAKPDPTRTRVVEYHKEVRQMDIQRSNNFCSTGGWQARALREIGSSKRTPPLQQRNMWRSIALECMCFVLCLLLRRF